MSSSKNSPKKNTHLQNRNSRRNQQKKSKGKRRPSTVRGAVRISPISTQPIQTRSIRYSLEGLNKVYITYVDLQGILLSVVNSSTNAVSIIGSLQLMDVTVTLIPGENTTGTMTLGWFGERLPETNETLIYGQGVPMRYTARPPVESYASFWISSDDDYSAYSDTALFSIDMGNINGSVDGSVVFLDLHFKYTIVDGSAKAYTLSIAAPLTGITAARIGTTALGSTHTGDFLPVGLDGSSFTNII